MDTVFGEAGSATSSDRAFSVAGGFLSAASGGPSAAAGGANAVGGTSVSIVKFYFASLSFILLHQLSHQLQVNELVQQNKNLMRQKNELENENAQFRAQLMLSLCSERGV